MFATRAFPRMAQVFPRFTVCTLAKIRGSMPNRQRPCAKPPQQNSHLHQLCGKGSGCDKILPTVAFSHRQWTMELVNCPLFGFGPAQNEDRWPIGACDHRPARPHQPLPFCNLQTTSSTSDNTCGCACAQAPIAACVFLLTFVLLQVFICLFLTPIESWSTAYIIWALAAMTLSCLQPNFNIS